MENPNDHRLAVESQELLRDYRESADEWRRTSRRNDDFRYGDNDAQWEKADKARLVALRHPVVTRNFIRPSVENAVASLTNKSPAFRVAGRDDNDVRKARLISNFLSYQWYISDGDVHLRTVADNYMVRGMGCGLVYVDPDADYGLGEIKWMAIDPWSVFIDPSAKNRGMHDASDILYVQRLTAKQFTVEWSKYAHLLKAEDIEASTETLIPDAMVVEEEGLQREASVSSEVDYYDVIWRYTKLRKKHYRIFDRRSDKLSVMNEKERKAWGRERVMGVVTADQFLEVKSRAQLRSVILQLRLSGVMFEEFSGRREDLIGMIYDEIPFNKVVIRQAVSVGNKLMFVEELPISRYPIVFFVNIHTGTPYPRGDVATAISPQKFVNKMSSLVAANLQAQTNIKLLVPITQDPKTIQDAWNATNAVVPYDPSGGEPKFATPPPISGAVIQTIYDAKHEIEYNFGIFEASMGNAAEAHPTQRGTIAIDEFAQRRIRYKLKGLEAGLTDLGQVMLEWSQSYYTAEKVFSVVQPDGVEFRGKINAGADQFTEDELQALGDLTVGRYDVIVVAGSTMPSNRWAEFDVYRQAYVDGLIDREECLKKTEIFDRVGVLERMSEISQLSAENESLKKKMADMEGDAQTMERELRTAGRKVDLSKWRERMAMIRLEYEARLKDMERDENVKVEDSLRAFDEMMNDYGKYLESTAGQPEKDSAKHEVSA